MDAMDISPRRCQRVKGDTICNTQEEEEEDCVRCNTSKVEVIKLTSGCKKQWTEYLQDSILHTSTQEH